MDLQQRPGSLDSDTLLELLHRARWAPSGDNCQPWRVRPNANGIALEFDQSPFAFLDYQGESSRIAMGAFAENIRLASSAMGMDCQIDFLADDSPVWANVTFAGKATADPLSRQIEDRCSNRRLYEPGSVSAEESSDLLRCLDTLDEIDLRLFETTDDLKTLAQAIGIADRIRMRHRACHEEFHHKIRWTQAEADAKQTGFFVKTFEIKAHEKLALQMTKRYGILRFCDVVVRMGDMAAAVARRQVRRSGAIGVLTTTSRSAENMMNVGVALQRLWLKATEQGLAFQVLAVAPIMLRRSRMPDSGLDAKQQAQVERVRTTLSSLNELTPDDMVLMFRVGRSSPPSARTNRVDADQLLVQRS